VLGAALVSALVAGPLGGLIIAIASIVGYPAGELAETSPAMLLVWGVLTGFFAACLPAAVFGAVLGQYVRRGRSRGEHGLRLRAMVAGAALGATFGTGMYFLGAPGAPFSLLVLAGVASGALCGAMITFIVDSDHRADAAAAQQ
jgi:hypothetical protein